MEHTLKMSLMQFKITLLPKMVNFSKMSWSPTIFFASLLFWGDHLGAHRILLNLCGRVYSSNLTARMTKIPNAHHLLFFVNEQMFSKDKERGHYF